MNINFAIARSNNLYLLHARLGGSIRNFGILNISSIQEWWRLMKIGVIIVSSSSSWRNRKYINSVDPLNWRLIILLVLILCLFLKMDILVECKYILYNKNVRKPLSSEKREPCFCIKFFCSICNWNLKAYLKIEDDNPRQVWPTTV